MGASQELRARRTITTEGASGSERLGGAGGRSCRNLLERHGSGMTFRRRGRRNVWPAHKQAASKGTVCVFPVQSWPRRPLAEKAEVLSDPWRGHILLLLLGALIDFPPFIIPHFPVSDEGFLGFFFVVVHFFTAWGMGEADVCRTTRHQWLHWPRLLPWTHLTDL